MRMWIQLFQFYPLRLPPLFFLLFLFFFFFLLLLLRLPPSWNKNNGFRECWFVYFDTSFSSILKTQSLVTSRLFMNMDLQSYSALPRPRGPNSTFTFKLLTFKRKGTSIYVWNLEKSIFTIRLSVPYSLESRTVMIPSLPVDWEKSHKTLLQLQNVVYLQKGALLRTPSPRTPPASPRPTPPRPRSTSRHWEPRSTEGCRSTRLRRTSGQSGRRWCHPLPCELRCLGSPQNIYVVPYLLLRILPGRSDFDASGHRGRQGQGE